MSNIISQTVPNAEGELLWKVEASGSWYDNDPRGSGYRPVGACVFVLAKTAADARKKCEPLLAKAREDSEKPLTIQSSIVVLEDILPSAGRKPLVLELPEDASRYRIGVCLIPIDPE